MNQRTAGRAAHPLGYRMFNIKLINIAVHSTISISIHATSKTVIGLY